MYWFYENVRSLLSGDPLAFYSKEASSDFLRSTASSSSRSGNDCCSHVTDILLSYYLLLGLLSLSIWVYYIPTHTILGFHLVFIRPSSGFDVTGHKGLTITFYGHRVKQKDSAFD